MSTFVTFLVALKQTSKPKRMPEERFLCLLVSEGVVQPEGEHWTYRQHLESKPHRTVQLYFLNMFVNLTLNTSRLMHSLD